tara:strand:- start:118 stop:1107 length:990 start_codon:yes stop_codon:yes gene_type:complete
MADWKPFEAGTTITGTEIANKIASVGAEINDLDETAIPGKALNRDHLPPASNYMGTKLHTAEATKVSSYRYTFPGWPTARMSGGAWDRVPLTFGEEPGKNWFNKLPNSTSDISLDFDRHTGLLVLANAHVTKLNWIYKSQTNIGGFVQPKVAGAKSKGDGSVTLGTDVSTGLIKPSWVQGNTSHIYGFFMLALKDAAGNYYPVPKTLRYIDSDTNTNSDSDAEHRVSREIPEGSFEPENSGCKAMPRIYKDVPIRSFIRHNDIVPREIGVVVPSVFTEIQLLASVLVNHEPVVSGSSGTGYMWVKETRVTGMTPNLGSGFNFRYNLDAR